MSVVAGKTFTCALLSDSTVSCWGENGNGQLGNGKLEMSSVPVLVVANASSQAPLKPVTHLAAGPYHACAVMQNGTSFCWGRNSWGQLGNGKTEDSSAPVQTAISYGVEIGAGESHSCARDRDGVVSCWGEGYYGQLGNGSTDDSLEPVKAGISAAARGIDMGDTHGCAVIGNSSATIECWGYNYYGEVGNGTYVEQDSPVEVKELVNGLTVTCGGEHSCALVGRGTAQCWGNGDFGQLGDGTTAYTSTPSTVLGF